MWQNMRMESLEFPFASQKCCECWCVCVCAEGFFYLFLLVLWYFQLFRPLPRLADDRNQRKILAIYFRILNIAIKYYNLFLLIQTRTIQIISNFSSGFFPPSILALSRCLPSLRRCKTICLCPHRVKL